MGLLRCIPREDNSKTGNVLWSIPGRVPPLHSLPATCIFQARCAMARPECDTWRPVLKEIGADVHTGRGVGADEELASGVEPLGGLVSTRPAKASIPGRGTPILSATRRSRCLFWDQLDQQALAQATYMPGDLLLAQGADKGKGTPLDVSDLKVHYQVSGGMLSLQLHRNTVKAVDGVSFRVPARSTLGLVGESGCGKSTVARAIAGLAPITAGHIRFGDRSLDRPVRQRPAKVLQMLQMVFQNPDSTLNPQKTVEQELQRPLRLFGVVPRKDEDRAISELLAAVNLDDTYRERYPGQLSGGEKQRVAIARAFAERPQLVLCDEPASSLDVSVQSMVLNLLLRLQQEFGVSLVFISHDLNVVRYISDYVAVVYLGKLCEIGRVDQIFRPPYHPYTEALLSAVPVPDPTIRRERIQLQGSVPSPINPPAGCRFHTRCPRKLGPICEQQAPAPTEENGHLIYCHIPRRELRGAQGNLGEL
jgi:peptide/nickel transport system ATP-binding protein